MRINAGEFGADVKDILELLPFKVLLLALGKRLVQLRSTTTNDNLHHKNTTGQLRYLSSSIILSKT